MKDANGIPLCYVGINRDISARKRHEAELRTSEAELADLFDTAIMGMHWLAPDGYIIRVNQSELDMLGYKREEYLGRHMSDFHVDESVAIDLLGQLAEGKEVTDYEARLRAKEGSIKYIRITSSAYLEDGRLVHSRCFTRDITERRRTEQRVSL